MVFWESESEVGREEGRGGRDAHGWNAIPMMDLLKMLHISTGQRGRRSRTL